MPRIISDELFDSLMQCVKDQRLLGVMGKLERLRDEAEVAESSQVLIFNGKSYTTYWCIREVNGGPETNNN